MPQIEPPILLSNRLDALCNYVESMWPDVIAGYRNFALPRMMPEDTDVVIEVFFVSQAFETAIIRGTFRQRRAIWRQFRQHVAIVCHDEETTCAHYLADANYLKAIRSRAIGFTSAAQEHGNLFDSPDRQIFTSMATEVLIEPACDVNIPSATSVEIACDGGTPAQLGSISWSTAA